MSRTKRRIANLDPAESYKPQLVTTQWLDNDGVVRTTTHDGNFSPSPQEPTLVFVPAQFCDEFYIMRIMEDRKENPQQVENGSYKYLRTAFLSPNSQQSATGKSTIDGNEQNASVVGRISVKTSTISDFSEDFQGFLEPYIDNYEIIFTDAQIEDWLESGTHTLKVEYNGEESETMTFTVASGDYMYFEAAEANSTVSMTSSLATAPNLEYSTDGVTWQEWQHTTADSTHTFDTLTLSSIGDRVYLRGVNSAGFLDVENGKISLFFMAGKIAAGGNAQSLVDGDTPTLVAKTMPFFSAFITTEQPSDVLTQAPALPATTLANNCYAAMFEGCTGLTQAPTLPATTLADGCYSAMFEGCTGLTQAPALPATTLANSCYTYMFSGCTGLTQAPALPATTLANSCYINMFSGCTGLTQAPALPATTLANSCYTYMFTGCTFNMSDDGTTFNFQCDATLPQTVGEATFSTPAELAGWMGNENGFTEP